MDKLISIFTDVGTELAKASVNKAIEEAGYLCCYQSYVDDFDDQRKKLSDVGGSVREDIKDARDRNETRIDPIVQGWLDEADGLIQQDTTSTSKKKWFFDLCPNCIWQNRRSKELKGNTQVIKDLITDRSNLPPVARPAEIVGIEFYTSPDFMHFESREMKFEQLKEGLKDVKNCMIGLYGMGGTGKTTMVKQVGTEFKELKVFDKVIVIVVSNANQPADVIKIRGDIAKHLGLRLEEGRESEHADKLSTRIAEGKEKILIILDDVWDKELNLKAIGIPYGQHQEGRCSILITARNVRVCREMGCQKAIQLETLSMNDALNLFLFHSGKSGDDDSSNTDFKEVASNIVNQCGRLPAAIVPLARALQSEPLEYWKDTLIRLQNFDPMSHEVHEDLTDAYKSLSLSYETLKDPKAQILLHLCSLFPEDFEIPVELLTRIAIGMGLCAKADKYRVARSQVSALQHKLVDSCLLLTDAVKPGFLCSGALHMVTEKCVKMHDLTREVAHLIAKEEIQEVTGSKSTLTKNIKCLSWNKNGFPDRFDGGELEFLLVIINAEGEVQVHNALFEGMTKLRVLILFCGDGRRYSGPSVPSLLNSTHTLKYLQTLLLKHWKLGDIQVIGSLESLETLELIGCYITKLPDEVAKLKKLRLLGLINCAVDIGNPFKVIERCPILEELYYIQNFGERFSTDELGHIEAPTTLESYHIIGNDTTDADLEVGNSVIRRCFRPDQLCKIFSEATIKYLATRAEILQLKDDRGRWTNVIPEIDPTEGMKDLIKLSLESCPNMKSLIHLDHRHSDVTIFSKLVQLELVSMGLRELFDGPLPTKLKDTLFKKLEVLCMKGCPGLEGTLFKEELYLGNLKSIELFNCSITFLFLPSTAWSLKQLEKLVITRCEQLKYIIVDEGSEERNVDVQNQKGHDGSNFKLKILQVDSCPKLEFLYPIYFAEVIQQLEEVKIASCGELKYIFGQYPNEEGSYQIQNHVILPSLKQVRILYAKSFIGMFPAECCHPISPVTTTQDGLKVEVRDPSPTFTFSRNLFCCFCSKSSDANHVVSKETLPDQTGLQILKTKRDFTLDSCLMRGPLSTSYITEMEIFSCPSLTSSLFTLHVASSMSLLEKLDVYECHGLKQIVTDEGDGHEHMNYNSIFPKLRKMVIYDCDHLENVFPASHFMIDHLEVITIEAVPKLRYVFGKSNRQDIVPHQNQNVEILLPALKKINLSYAPDMVNICIENFHTTAFSLESITVEKCPQLCISPFIDFGGSRLEDHTTRKAVEIQPEKYIELSLENLKTDKIYDLERLQIKGPARSGLEKLRIEELPLLTDICVGMKNSLSLHNLSSLSIHQCKKLKFIFSASILRSLPKLTHLEAFECEELLQIIEETEEYGLVSNHNCFPELRIISVKNCNKLKCLFSISACGILPKLEELSIEEAPELVKVIGCKQCETKEQTDVFPRLSDEGDGHHHMNYNSIFPELRQISILNCDHLENAFPASHCTKLDHLEDITVHGVPKLRYVFGKCSCQDILPHQNQNAEILLPVLKDINIYAAPNMVNIWIENVHTPALSLEKITVNKCPELCISPFIDFGGGRLETQQEDLSSRKAVEIQPEKFIKLFLSDVKTDKIYDLERLQIKGPAARSGLKELTIFDLPILTDICVGIENSLSLHNLSSLTIFRCKKLQFIFSASILPSLPKLEEIMVVECEELLQIIEETEGNGVVSSQNCFPELRIITVSECNKLKCLFSISACGTLPKLEEVGISEASELVQVFGCKQCETKELTQVFPKLSYLELDNLQSLESVCQGIDFQMVKKRAVTECPKISLTSTAEDTTSTFEESQAAKSQSMSSPPYICEEKIINQIVEETSKRAPNMTEIQEIEEQNDQDGLKLNDSLTPDQTILSEQSVPSQAPCVIPLQNISPQETLVDEEAKKETSILGQQAPNTKVSVGEGPSSEKDNKLISSTHLEQDIAHSGPSTSTKELHENKSSNEEGYGESISTTEAPRRVDKPFNNAQKVKEPTNARSFKEKTGKTAVAAPPKLVETKDVAFNPVFTSSVDTSPMEIVEASVRDGPKVEDAMISDQTMDSKELHVKKSMDDGEALGEGKRTKEDPGRIEKSLYNAQKDDISPVLISSITTFKEPQAKTATNDQEPRASQSNQDDVSGNTDSPQGQMIVNQTEIDIGEQFEEDDLFKLFRIVEEGADMEVGMSYVSKFVVEDDDKVAKAFSDLEASLKMSLNEIASSEENSLRLQNALNLLSANCLEDEAPSHGLSATIGSLRQEIQSILSSFKQASSTVHAFTALEEKEKCINEELPRRKKAAKTLLSEIYNIEKSVVEAQHKEAELKEHISRLQAEVSSKEKEIKECEIKLSSLQEQKKKSVFDTIGFIKEFEAVKKERSQMVEEQIKARQELEKVDAKWPSCVANLKKTALLLGIHLNHKL